MMLLSIGGLVVVGDEESDTCIRLPELLFISGYMGGNFRETRI